ncbi:hypothetical protein lerEdw1_002719 [Lerista edwardsae]|nr:hypothetical protein lerEdw1_002719 [Lerista edwardsae]
MRSLLLAFAVLLSWSDASQHRGHHHRNCFRPEEVPEGGVPAQFLSRTARLGGHTSLQLVPSLEEDQPARGRQRRHHEHRCPRLQSQSTLSSEVHERSISPWTYRIDEDKDRFPEKLAFAECLCKGCIDSKTGAETTALNSVPVLQSLMVLHRKPCQHGSDSPGFTFEVRYIKVPVACTCALPRSSR